MIDPDRKGRLKLTADANLCFRRYSSSLLRRVLLTRLGAGV